LRRSTFSDPLGIGNEGNRERRFAEEISLTRALSPGGEGIENRKGRGKKRAATQGRPYVGKDGFRLSPE